MISYRQIPIQQVDKFHKFILAATYFLLIFGGLKIHSELWKKSLDKYACG